MLERPVLANGAVILALAVAGSVMFMRTLDIGFWSPEDLHALNEVTQAQLNGNLTSVFNPTFSGGYPVNPIFALEFSVFGLDPRPYLVVNLLVHILNASLAFLLVNSLLHDRRSSFVAALLFVITVGSYGKNLMFASGVSSLAYATTCLLATLLYVNNEKRHAGRFWSPSALAFHVVFFASLFMRGGSVSILAAILFYNVFFMGERRRPVLHTNTVVAIGLLLFAAMLREVGVLGVDGSATANVSAGAFLKNLPGYMILMVFPLQQSTLLDDAPVIVQWLYRMAPLLRAFVGLSILSFSLFGFVFGNRAIRFYIAWMYVMLVPFAFFRYSADWLNLRFLYLVSLGFCVVLTTGTFYAYRLLHHRKIRRYISFSILFVYIVATIFFVWELEGKNAKLASRPEARELLENLTQQLN